MDNKDKYLEDLHELENNALGSFTAIPKKKDPEATQLEKRGKSS